MEQGREKEEEERRLEEDSGTRVPLWENVEERGEMRSLPAIFTVQERDRVSPFPPSYTRKPSPPPPLPFFLFYDPKKITRDLAIIGRNKKAGKETKSVQAAKNLK